MNHPMSMNRWMYASGNPIRFIDPTGHYDRDAAVRYALSHDLMDPFPSAWRVVGKPFSSECAAFASFTLSKGGVKDSRSEPPPYTGEFNLTWYHDYDNADGSNYWPNPEASYWNGDWAGSPQPFGDHLGITFTSWMRTEDLFKFLTETMNFTAYRISTNDNGNGLRSILDDISDGFNKGDLVFYGEDFDHVAVITNKWAPQTFFGGFTPLEEETNLSRKTTWTSYQVYDYATAEQMKAFKGEALEVWRETRCDAVGLPWMPRVVERSGGVLYHSSRSINNTIQKYSQITIVHTP